MEIFQKNIYFCSVDCAKSLDAQITKIPWKILQEMGIPKHVTCLPVCRSKAKLEPDMEQDTDSKLGKASVKAVYFHLAYLTYMQSISYKMLGWMKHKLESRLLGKYQ